ncbi:unnamed protein product [Durusdinium trenchii]|uniref:Uncharacterized protein n=1 Tax=Durusdinium trenchii TaxID=1381693 RepID=A0ABP0IZD2_9DINO
MLNRMLLKPFAFEFQARSCSVSWIDDSLSFFGEEQLVKQTEKDVGVVFGEVWCRNWSFTLETRNMLPSFVRPDSVQTPVAFTCPGQARLAPGRGPVCALRSPEVST